MFIGSCGWRQSRSVDSPAFDQSECLGGCKCFLSQFGPESWLEDAFVKNVANPIDGMEVEDENGVEDVDLEGCERSDQFALIAHRHSDQCSVVSDRKVETRQSDEQRHVESWPHPHCGQIDGL